MAIEALLTGISNESQRALRIEIEELHARRFKGELTFSEMSREHDRIREKYNLPEPQYQDYVLSIIKEKNYGN